MLRLKISPRAYRDAQYIFDYIAERSPDGALRWWMAFDTAASQIAHNPDGYSLAPENDLVNYQLRQFLFKKRRGRIYRRVFTVVGDEVQILRVRGPGQGPLQSDEIE